MMSSDSQAMGRIGEVICRTWQTARQDEAAARRAARRHGRQRQLARPALHRQIHDQPGDRARHRRARRLDRGRQDGRPRAVEAGVLRRQAGAGDQGRLDRRRHDGRRQRVDSDAAAGHRPADVRRLRRRAADVQRALRQPGRHRRRQRWRGLGRPLVAVRGCRGVGKKDLVLNDALPKIEVDPETYEVRADGELLRASRPRCSRWRSGTSCSEGVRSRSLHAPGGSSPQATGYDEMQRSRSDPKPSAPILSWPETLAGK